MLVSECSYLIFTPSSKVGSIVTYEEKETSY